MSHKTRPVKPGRVWSLPGMGDYEWTPSTTSELDPRNDYTDADEQYELEVAFAKRRQEQQRRQQEKTQ